LIKIVKKISWSSRRWRNLKQRSLIEYKRWWRRFREVFYVDLSLAIWNRLARHYEWYFSVRSWRCIIYWIAEQIKTWLFERDDDIYRERKYLKIRVRDIDLICRYLFLFKKSSLKRHRFIDKKSIWLSFNKRYFVNSSRRFLSMMHIEKKVLNVLRKAYDTFNHWTKIDIIAKVHDTCPWSQMTLDVKRYIVKCQKCVKYKSAQRSQSLHSIQTMYLFQLIEINFIESLIEMKSTKHILY
jgi:hypothetical protein